MPHSKHDDTELLVPPIYQEDLQQEAALLKLMGKEPSMAILLKKHQTFQEYLFDQPAENAIPLSWGRVIPPEETLEQLILWAMDQSEKVQQLVFQLLEHPNEKTLKFVMKKLTLEGVILHEAEPVKELSFTQMVLNLLEKDPRSLEDLYEFARNTITSRRPEAAVRQIIRRLIKENQLEEVNGLYRRTNS